MPRSRCDGCRVGMLVAAILARRWAPDATRAARPRRSPSRRQPPPPTVAVSQARAARDRRMGRIHRPLRRGRDRRGARPRLRLPHRGAFQGRAGRQAGRSAVRDRPAAVRARAGAGAAELFAGHRPRSRTPISTSCAASRCWSGAIISEKTFDDRENLVRDAQAAVKVAEAKVKTRRARPVVHPHRLADRRPHQPHAWSRPATGSAPAAPPTATLLTTIVSQDPIYIYFDVSENNYIKYKRLAERGAGAGAADLGATVEIGAARRARLPAQGASSTSSTTGSTRAPARCAPGRVMANEAGLFSPGMFARVRVTGTAAYAALLLPDEAIGTDQTNKFVYVVGDDGTVARRNVKLGPAGRWLARGARGHRRRATGSSPRACSAPAPARGGAQARGPDRVRGAGRKAAPAKVPRMKRAAPCPRARRATRDEDQPLLHRPADLRGRGVAGHHHHRRASATSASASTSCPRSPRRRSPSPPAIPAPARRPSPTRSPRPSSRRSTASRA